MQGASALAQTLAQISRKGTARRETDINLEYEIVKVLRNLFNNSVSSRSRNSGDAPKIILLVCGKRSVVTPPNSHPDRLLTQYTSYSFPQVHP